MDKDLMYMERALELAYSGEGRVSPNPKVGAVVVCDDKIIGEGYHRICGQAHAEVNAINSVKDHSLLQRSTIYVTLEPCSHYGKTPPCAELIIRSKIPRVVIGCADPFPEVSGRGIRMLRSAGIEVVVGVLEKECAELNSSFMHFHKTGKPYVILKWAQSEDGFIDVIRKDAQTPPVVFSTPYTQMLVHKLRAESDAILVGANTVRLDDPSLTVRSWHGRSPRRIIVGSSLSEDMNFRVFDGSVAGYLLKPTEDKNMFEALFQLAKTEQIHSVLVEGGSRVLQSFIDAGYWNELRVEIAPVSLKEGVSAPIFRGRLAASKKVDGRVLLTYLPR